MTAKPTRILLVDDEQSIVETLTILFRGAGYEVIPAVGGKGAWRPWRRRSPTSWSPTSGCRGARGLEVLARAREVDPEIPVILMTAQASLQSAVQAVNQGAFYYIQKPFSNDELLAICARAVENRAS
jgi:DNA-binding NtrC family response regulator